jgi:glyoxylase-like metal-dependent hydrolase (beta-lactamase superfamily II)
MKLNDDVFLLPLLATMNGQPRQFNLTLMLDAAHGPTLVDTGLPGQEGAVAAALAETGLRVQDLRRIILTHQDIDHVGSLHALVQASGARVLAHAVEAAYIDGTLRSTKYTPELLAQLPEVQMFLDKLEPTPVDEHLHDGTRLELVGGVRVIFTPGHTPGHISLYLERTRTLVTGDALLINDGQLTEPNPHATPDMVLARQSIQKLAELDVQTIVCFHGGVLCEGASEQLRGLAQEAASAQH